MKKNYLFTLMLFIASTSFTQKFYQCFDNDNNPDLKISVEYLDGSPVSIKFSKDNSSVNLEEIKNSTKNHNGVVHSESNSYFEIKNGVKNGKFTITHSGIYDYLVYTGKDGKKSKYTINLDESVNLEGDGYRSTPCF
jgi:hypothetical protein